MQAQAKPSTELQSSESPAFRFFGLPFASKKVLLEFLLATFFVVVVPIILVVFINGRVKNSTELSELQKVAYSVIPAVVVINVVIGVYIYKAVKDPENYKKDPPLVMRAKKD